MAFKEIKLNVTSEKVGGKWAIRVDGELYDMVSLGKKFKVHYTSIKNSIHTMSDEEFSAWLSNRAELNSVGLTSSSRLFKNGEDVCWSKCVCEAIGCSISKANIRLHAWMRGEITTDDLFNPIIKIGGSTKERKRKGPANWGGLSRADRDKNIKKLKNPGTWEQEQPEPHGVYNGEVNHNIGFFHGGALYRGD